MKSTGDYGKLFLIVLTARFILVTGHNNCTVDIHCLTQEGHNLTRNITNEEMEQSKDSKMMIPFKNADQIAKHEKGFKRDKAFSDVLKNLLAMVDKVKPNAVTFPSRKPATTSVPGTTIAPSSPEISTVSSPSASPPTSVPSVATTEGAATSSPSAALTSTTAPIVPTSNQSTNQVTPTPLTPTPTISVTPSGNASKPPGKPGGQPGQNVTIAPGIVVAPSGEIIFNPHFPLLPGAGQTSGGTPFPFPLPLTPGGVSPVGIPTSPGTASQPGGVGVQSGPQATPGTLFTEYDLLFVNE